MEKFKKKVGRPLGWRKPDSKKMKSYRLSNDEEFQVKLLLASLRNKNKKKFQINKNFESVFLFPDQKAPKGKLYSTKILTDLSILESDLFAPIDIELVDILEETKLSYVIKPLSCKNPFKIDRRTLSGKKKDKANMGEICYFSPTYQLAYKYILLNHKYLICRLLDSVEFETKNKCLDILLEYPKFEALDYFFRLFYHLNPPVSNEIDEKDEYVFD